MEPIKFLLDLISTSSQALFNRICFAWNLFHSIFNWICFFFGIYSIFVCQSSMHSFN